MFVNVYNYETTMGPWKRLLRQANAWETHTDWLWVVGHNTKGRINVFVNPCACDFYRNASYYVKSKAVVGEWKRMRRNCRDTIQGPFWVFPQLCDHVHFGLQIQTFSFGTELMQLEFFFFIRFIKYHSRTDLSVGSAETIGHKREPFCFANRNHFAIYSFSTNNNH